MSQTITVLKFIWLERSQQIETWICANIAVERKYLDMRRELILYGVLFTPSLSANKE